MPLVPNTLEHAMFNTFNLAPAPMLDIFAGLGHRMVYGALKLGVFEALKDKTLTAPQLAQKLGVNEAGLYNLLQVMVSLKYLSRKGDAYTNSKITRKWLVSGVEVDFSPYFLFWGAVLPILYSNFEESIQTGKPAVNLYEWIENEPEISDYFQRAMISLAKFAIGEMRPLMKTNAKKLLDIGGGHGMYSLAFCRENPQLQATIFDTPQPLVTARQHIAAEKMENRIDFQEGSFITDELGSGYDLALVINIIHGFTPEQNLDLLSKAAKALNKGGQVFLVEQFEGKTPLPLANAVNNILGMNYFHLLGGKIYRREEVEAWLKQVGFSQVTHKILRISGSSVLIGTLPS